MSQSASHVLDEHLSQWGEWARGGIGTGYRLSGLCRRTGTGRAGDEEIAVAIDRAVASVTAADQRILKDCYLCQVPGHAHAERLGISLSTYRRRLRTAKQALALSLGWDPELAPIPRTASEGAGFGRISELSR